MNLRSSLNIVGAAIGIFGFVMAIVLVGFWFAFAVFLMIFGNNLERSNRDEDSQ